MGHRSFHTLRSGEVFAPKSISYIFPVLSAAASHKPIPCPAGTFSSLPEQTTSSTCRTCPSGFYCKDAGLQAPSGWCPAGKGRGEMTSGKIKGQGQLSGYGQGASGSRSHWQGQDCQVEGGAILHRPSLLPGYYCDSSSGPVQDFSLYPCPRGYYCPVGTAKAMHHSCPVGTYGPQKGLTSITECQLCPAGKFCSLAGITAPTGTKTHDFFLGGGVKRPWEAVDLSGDKWQECVP